MTELNNSIENIFQEAIRHCRWKRVLRTVVLTNPILCVKKLSSFSDNTFEEILLHVYNICIGVYSIGPLVVYDITAAICRYNKIIVDKIYIVGGGPRRALELLNIKPKIQKMDNISLKYIEIPELLEAFRVINHELPSYLKNNNNGDEFESYICHWQKAE